MNHDANCKCRLCSLMTTMTKDEALQQFLREQEEMMKKYGWFAHYVNDDSEYVLGINYHTHGLPETYDHPDLQIVFPLEPKLAHSLFWNVINKIKDGEHFKDGDTAEGIVKGYSVKFMEAVENDRTVLRIILPDKSGNLERKDLTEQLAKQYS